LLSSRNKRGVWSSVVVQREQAQVDLDPFLARLFECVTKGVADYDATVDPGVRATLSTRTQSSLINDRIAFRASALFSGAPGVRVLSRSGSTRVLIGDKYQIRFKKLSKNRRSSNVPTQAVMDFIYQMDRQLGQMSFGFQAIELTNLDVGYQWNVLRTEVAGVFAVCPNGTRNEWVLEIAKPTAEPTRMRPRARKRARVRLRLLKPNESASGATDGA
jgi:hypothetical protein